MSCNIAYDNLIFAIHKISKINPDTYFVFIGKIDNDLRPILNKLENRANIDKKEVILLRDNYSDYYLDWINIVKKKIKIKFIPYKIEIDDSINEIRKKIFIYLSDPNNKLYILPENQELWLENNDNRMEIIGYYYENLNTKIKDLMNPHIYESFNETFIDRDYKKNTSENNMLIYDILDNSTFKKKVIYLSDAKDEEEYLLKNKKIKITENTINKYFKRYWPYVNLNYNINEIKNNFQLLQKYYFNEDYFFKLINNNISNKDIFGSCNIITATLTVTQQKTDNSYIDLFPVFDYIRENIIDENTPFLKYYENTLESPFSIISNKAIENNKISKKILKDWLGLNKETKKINSIIIKRFLKDYNNEPRYSHIFIDKFGNIRLNIAFLGNNNATFDDIEYASKDCKKLIDDINKNRIIKKTEELKKIESPLIEIINNKVTLRNNTNITFMNIIIPLKLNKPIDFKKLSEFAMKFPYFLVELNSKDDNKIEKSIQLKYKRVSGFANMSDILFDIDKLKETYDQNIGIIIKILEKKYQKSVDEIKQYLIEWERRYSSSKSSKISSDIKKGILVKINDNNILIDGITKIYQIPLLYNFFTTFLTLFIDYDNYFKNKNFKKIFSSDIIYNENKYEINNNVNLNIYQMDYDDYDLDEDIYLEDENEDDKDILLEDNGKMNNYIPGVVDESEIDPNIRLTCDDAIPDKDTCTDFCNDSGYFLRRLQKYDNKLFYIKNEKKKEQFKTYSKKCMRKDQPVILTKDPETDPNINRDSYTYSVKYSSDPNTFERWYVCPKAWCPMCEIPILIDKIDKKTIKVRITDRGGGLCKTGICPNGDHQVFIRDNNNAFYPGFLDKSTHPNGLCMPCCFKTPHTNPKSKFYKGLKKCIGEEIENEVIKDGQIYILGKGIPIEKDRYGLVPFDIARILKTNIETGILGFKSGYIRKGIKHIEYNSFLCCIADIISCDKNNAIISLSKLKNILIEKLNDNIFKSVYNGNLPNIFHNPSEKLTPLENFKNYILNDKIDINHQYLWDFLQRKNILFEDGVNIFIFENNKLLCPKGENINNFYEKDKKNILIIKSREYYEPIYYLEGTGKSAKKICIFNNENEQIKKIYDISMEGCKMKEKIDWIALLKDNIKKYDLQLDNLTISNGYDLQEVLYEILINIKNKNLNTSFIPHLQYVDSYNKVFGILLNNGLYYPVDSNKIFDQLKYKIVNNNDDIHKLSLNDTIKFNEEISNKTKLKSFITHKVIDQNNKKYITAVINNFNRFIPIKSIIDNDKKLKISNLNYYIDIDTALSNKIEKIDKRISIINRKNFEDETYIRLKFELSKFLQIKNNNNYLNDILNIINSTDKNITENRKRMYTILDKIYSKLIVMKNKDINYNNYKTPNKRIPCFLRDSNSNIKLSCDDDQHCTKDGNKCKLFVNKNNLLKSNSNINNYNYYLFKIIDELLRFKMKRNEILNDNIPTIINKELIEYNNKYIIIHTFNNNEINNIVEKIYLDNKGLHIDNRNLYEETYTKDISFKKDQYIKSDILSIINNKVEELSIYWSKLLNNKYKVKINSNDNLFSIINLILNLEELKNNSININILKNKIITYIKKTNESQILDIYSKNGTKIFKYITSIDSLIEEILSESYNGSEADLEFITKMFNINVVILDKRIKKNQNGYRIFKSNNYRTDFFILIYKSIILNNNIYNIIYSKNKLMFKINELPQNFVNKIIL